MYPSSLHNSVLHNNDLVEGMGIFQIKSIMILQNLFCKTLNYMFFLILYSFMLRFILLSGLSFLSHCNRNNSLDFRYIFYVQNIHVS